MITDKQTAHHYQWGKGCDSWELVNEPNLSVKQELMPPNTREVVHYHAKALQHFYILAGTATFFVEQQKYTVATGQGFTIQPGNKHYIENGGETALEFLVISQPTTKGDRVEAG